MLLPPDFAGFWGGWMGRFSIGMAVACLLGLGLRTSGAQVTQPACGIAPVASPTAQPNIFSEQQEEWLGEAMADEIGSSFSPVRDARLSEHLQAITDRLAATLPQTKIHFQATLVDSSAVNGFSIAGGRIYLTRKLAASAANDDELAAVLGHEIGHIASHQFAFETTRDLKRLTGVTSVGDRADIYAKFQALMTAELSDKHPAPVDDDSKQDEADRIGVYVTAAAGYRPQASAEFWNRVFFVGGKTRGKVADFFRITKPNEKRLRGMLALAATLPPGCGGTLKPDEHAFNEWHDAVVANQAAAAAVEVEAAVKVKLTPPLRSDLDRVRFSPDGKLILAQDASSVFVLGRSPLAPLFRFDADGALPAQFSPDSQKIVFSTYGMHTEEWSIGEKKLLAAHELLSEHPCFQSLLSPDGRTLVCAWAGDNFMLGGHVGLDLIDVQSGSVVWAKNPLMSPGDWFVWAVTAAQRQGLEADLLPFSLSPDGNTLVIGYWSDKVAIDLRTRSPIKMAGEFQAFHDASYAFVGNDRLLQMNYFDPKSSGVFSFPAGKRLSKLDVKLENIEAVSDSGGNQVLADGPKANTTGIADLAENKYLVIVKTAPLDAQGGAMVTEEVDGTIMTGKLHAATAPGDLQQTMLPISPLGRSRSISLSLDGRYLAISSRSRGGVWDVDTGKRMFLVKGFKNSSWDQDGNVYAEFTKEVKDEKPAKGGAGTKEERVIGKLVTSKNSTEMVNYKVEDKMSLRFGLLTEWKDDDKKQLQLVMHRLADGSPTWSKSFPAGSSWWFTQSFGERDLIFNYPVKSEPGRTMLKADAKLTDEANAIKDKNLGRLIEVVDQATGRTEAEMVLSLPLNYSGTDGLNRAGDLLYVSGEDNRTMVYSLSTGKQLRQLFGEVEAVDTESGRICTGNRRDEAVVYDADGKELAHYHLGDSIRFGHFRDHGKQLVVLTADQTVWTLKIDPAKDPVKDLAAN